MSSDRLRVVVWGLGRHAIRRILPAVVATERLELYGVCSRRAATVSDCAERWHCQGWTDPTSMLGDGDVDVVYLATPIGLHFSHGQLVLDAGKHLWCEKPLTTSLEQAHALVQASRTRRLSLCEGLMYLHHAQFRQISEYLSTGRLGAPKSIECRFGLPQLEDPGFRSDATLFGGAFFDIGCYPITALHALFPLATANIAGSCIRALDPNGIDTDGYATIELSNGVLAFLEWRRNAAYRNELSIWGDGGSLFTERIFSKEPSYVPKFRIRDTRGDETVEEGQADDHFLGMLNAFSETVVDQTAAEAERSRIIGRAVLMDRIWSTRESSSLPLAADTTRKVNA